MQLGVLASLHKRFNQKAQVSTPWAPPSVSYVPTASRQLGLVPELTEAINQEASIVLGKGRVEVAPIQIDTRRALGFNARLVETN